MYAAMLIVDKISHFFSLLILQFYLVFFLLIITCELSILLNSIDSQHISGIVNDEIKMMMMNEKNKCYLFFGFEEKFQDCREKNSNQSQTVQLTSLLCSASQ
ncbi:hypothetical protein DERF_001591 [Dermatophagoides farinae]|uniref:Uncharacterized protein n=1 Tax=Dermatophagoides farinae TaxID=6954 RepID=A0A922I9U0_DERFA|nr:hypothetical protein DERF_001591 [Dermatophagoides farinae]